MVDGHDMDDDPLNRDRLNLFLLVPFGCLTLAAAVVE